MNEQLLTRHNIKKWLQQHLELLFWTAAICFLFFMETDHSQPSLCILRLIGFNSCPGCGLGHSIHSALHLHFAQSFHEHPAGIPAVLIILSRIKQLSYSKKTTIYEA